NWIGTCEIQRHRIDGKDYIELLFPDEQKNVPKTPYLRQWLQDNRVGPAIMKCFHAFGAFIRQGGGGNVWQYPAAEKGVQNPMDLALPKPSTENMEIKF